MSQQVQHIIPWTNKQLQHMKTYPREYAGLMFGRRRGKWANISSTSAASVNYFLTWNEIGGLVKLKQIPKIREKLGLIRPHQPTHYQFFFFGNMKTTQKTQHFPQKIKIRVGAWPTHPLPSFSRIFGFFFGLTKPLNNVAICSNWLFLMLFTIKYSIFL